MVKCNVCDYQVQETSKNRALSNFEEELAEKPCPKCSSQSLVISKKTDLIENFAKMAEASNSNIEIISEETEEGQMLKKSFGGIGAILRFKLQG